MKTNDLLQPFALLLRLYLYLILVFTLGRVVLFSYYYPRLVESDINIWLTFLYGLRMDTITACLLLVFPAIFIHFLPGYFSKVGNNILRFYFLIVLVVAIYMENATLPFINEYDVRPNVLFINYLKYPKEVLGTIWATYKLELFLSAVMMFLAGSWFMKSHKSLSIAATNVALWKRLLLFVPVFFLLFAGIRSSFEHRPANPSDAIISNNRLLNEITKNTLHNVGYAFYSSVKHDGSARGYGNMPVNEARQRVAKRLNIKLGDESSPFKRLELSHFKTDKPKNLVILLEESLGAQFVSALGGEEGITPHLNALSTQGIMFDNLYSNGTRSIRGIAGTVSGFLPAPGQGVVKRNLAQRDFFTVASLLKGHGYATSFFYGGESRFDNMKSWFSGNGFDEIIEQSSFGSEVFHGTWGVDDVALVERANKRYKQWSDDGELFVSVIFTSTNHSPFDFPEGKIKLIEGVPEHSVKNAIAYADLAIGRLIELAKSNQYYDDTVFMIIADHNVRVYGDDVIPVNMFRIPGLILGGGIKPARIAALTSQPDVLATALDLTGLDLEYPILGHSIFSDNKTETTLLQYHDIYGLRVGNKIAIIQPDKPSVTYQVVENDRLKEIEHDDDLEKDAQAFVIMLNELYQRRQFN